MISTWTLLFMFKVTYRSILESHTLADGVILPIRPSNEVENVPDVMNDFPMLENEAIQELEEQNLPQRHINIRRNGI